MPDAKTMGQSLASHWRLMGIFIDSCHPKLKRVKMRGAGQGREDRTRPSSGDFGFRLLLTKEAGNKGSQFSRGSLMLGGGRAWARVSIQGLRRSKHPLPRPRGAYCCAGISCPQSLMLWPRFDFCKLSSREELSFSMPGWQWMLIVSPTGKLKKTRMGLRACDISKTIEC